MRNEKRMQYQVREIERLTKKVKDLEQENKALNSQIDINKSAILLREQALDEKERQLNETRDEYEALIVEVKQMREGYKKAIEEDLETRKKLNADLQKELKKIRRQK